MNSKLVERSVTLFCKAEDEVSFFIPRSEIDQKVKLALADKALHENCPCAENLFLSISDRAIEKITLYSALQAALHFFQPTWNSLYICHQVQKTIETGNLEN